MRLWHAPKLSLLALCAAVGGSACDREERELTTRTETAEIPRGRPIRGASEVEPRSDDVRPTNLAPANSNAGLDVATDAKTALDPVTLLEQHGFEALRMNDDERARIEASIAEHGRREIPITAFPERIRVLNGATTRIRGWMIPGEMIKGRARNFMLVRDNQACCFGAMPTFDEWIHVDMLGERGAEYVRYGQIEVSGVLEVGGPAVAEGVKPPALRMKATSCELIRRR